VHIAFTPDEEIGRGTEHFDLHHFACDFAYTVDGSSLGSLEYENFNAASASVIFHGINTHPGEAFGVMRNAALLAAQFACRLPLHFRPETTKGREGFFHLTSFQASVSHAELSIILRDFSATGLKTKKGHLIRLANEVNLLHPDACQLSITDQYSNMADILLRNPLPLHLAQRAMQLSGISPRIQPIRGGTDGARLTFLGLPCPNLFTGGAHFHSPQETLSISTFLQAILTLHTLLSLPPSHYPNLPSL
jgi:tripeptide aminopeptidase